MPAANIGLVNEDFVPGQEGAQEATGRVSSKPLATFTGYTLIALHCKVLSSFIAVSSLVKFSNKILQPQISRFCNLQNGGFLFFRSNQSQVRQAEMMYVPFTVPLHAAWLLSTNLLLAISCSGCGFTSRLCQHFAHFN